MLTEASGRARLVVRDDGASFRFIFLGLAHKNGQDNGHERCDHGKAEGRMRSRFTSLDNGESGGCAGVKRGRVHTNEHRGTSGSGHLLQRVEHC